MASLEDLKNVLKETLEKEGVLGQIKAQIRREIFTALDHDNIVKPQLSKENLLINELIREYLKYNNYNHSLSVFLSESGQPADPPFERDILSKELRIIEDKTTILFPLLYSLVLGLQKDKVTYGTGRKMEEENKLVDDDEDNLEPKPIMLQK